jgi:hypothetical protein
MPLPKIKEILYTHTHTHTHTQDHKIFRQRMGYYYAGNSS